MSLESTVSGLVQSTTRLTEVVDGKLSEIDKKVDEATASIPNKLREIESVKLYIDPVNGDDANDGAISRPKRTIRNAIYNGVTLGGLGDLRLMAGDHDIDAIISVFGRSVLVSAAENVSRDSVRLRINNVTTGAYFNIIAGGYLELGRHGAFRVEIEGIPAYVHQKGFLCNQGTGTLKIGETSTAEKMIVITNGSEVYVSDKSVFYVILDNVEVQDPSSAGKELGYSKETGTLIASITRSTFVGCTAQSVQYVGTKQLV